MRAVTFVPTFRAWQTVARRALTAGWEPPSVLWEELLDAQPGLGLGDGDEPEATPADAQWRVPKAFVSMATRVACHRDSSRWALLYRVLWRLTHGERELLEVIVDPDVHRLFQMEKSIRRDVHKMRAFVRFRAVSHEGDTWYVAWFEPEHHIVELNAPFFIDRFAQMRWSILTPDRCAHWDGAHLTITQGMMRAEAPVDDEVEKLWLTYYSHIFNPARVKEKAMTAEMPRKYWKNLPEAEIIPDLLEKAPARVREMIEKSEEKQRSGLPGGARAQVPVTSDLEILRQAAAGCEACPLYRQATQTVFGEGAPQAALVFVGEQPGDSEDLAGRPFVGPAGQLFDRALAEAGIERETAYVTNAVKHFKHELRGKRRIHKNPSASEMTACRPWLEAELGIIRPRVLVCLGGTAAKSLLGSAVRVLRDRGRIVSSAYCPATLITVHPSSILRAPDDETRAREYTRFVDDLRVVAGVL